MKKSILLATTLAFAASANAAQIWSDFSISVLQSAHYKVGPPASHERTYVTLEHVSGHTWGDVFLFLDRSSYNYKVGKYLGNNTEMYGEISPRLSLSKLTGMKMALGPLTDVYLAATWEHNTAGDFSFDNYLAGVGIDLKIPGFAWFKAAYYQAMNDKKVDANGELESSGFYTPELKNKKNDSMWHASFSLPLAKQVVWDGFLDFTPEKNEVRAETNFTTQLKYNVGSLIGTKNPVYVGVEHSHWNNKFSSNKDERATSMLVKWHF